MVVNILSISGAGDNRGAAERADGRFIQESEFALSVTTSTRQRQSQRIRLGSPLASPGHSDQPCERDTEEEKRRRFGHLNLRGRRVGAHLEGGDRCPEPRSPAGRGATLELGNLHEYSVAERTIHSKVACFKSCFCKSWMRFGDYPLDPTNRNAIAMATH